MTAIFSPVSELLEENEVLSEAANSDPLTDIPNRRLFNDRFARALREAASGKHRGALILIDLDRFKALNDLRGHPAGDEVLRESARRLRESVRQSDLVARLGGDEFAVLLGGLHPERKAAALEARSAAEKIRLSLARPFEVMTRDETGKKSSFRHFCPPSLGVAVFGGGGSREGAGGLRSRRPGPLPGQGPGGEHGGGGRGGNFRIFMSPCWTRPSPPG